MASKTKKKRTSTPGSEPLWPTTMRSRMDDGRLLGTDGSVWLYRAVPMDPVMDATTPRESLSPAFPIIAAYEEIASVTQTNLGRRNASKNNYRQTHMLLVNIPRRYSPPPGHPNSVRLRAQFGSRPVTRRILLFGVKLRGSITGNGIKSTVNSIVDTMVSGMAPLSDYDADFAIIEQAMTRAGLRTPTADDFRLANAWWNHGRAPDAPLLPHADHIHVFDTADSARAAQDAGVGSCGNWPHIQGHHAMTPISVRELDLHFDSALSDKARWVNDLLNSGALCVSIRGLVEPVKITTAELRRRQAQYREDIKERYAAGKMERADQEQTEADLTAIGAAYSTTGGPATLTDASIIAFFDGRQTDVENICSGSAVEPASMPFRQEAALGETWLASPIRANPNLHDLPITTVAYSALPSLSRVGDKTGALMGFTERDRQPGYISHIAAAREDSTPICAVLGSPGSGKSAALTEPIQTPNGPVRMGDLQVGDQVLGRDGKPCNVTYLSPIDLNPDLFKITFADGQSVKADIDHQWVVSTSHERRAAGVAGRPSALSRWEQIRAATTTLSALAEDSGHKTLTLSELRHIIFAETALSIPNSVLAEHLRFVGAQSHREHRPGLTAPIRAWAASIALKAISMRLSQIHEIRPTESDTVLEQVLTTGELLAAGLWSVGGPGFAIRTARAVQLPQVDLDIAPEILGAALPRVGGRIDSAYLHASIDQRTALLVGLMSAAGHTIGDDSRLTLVDAELAADALHLVRSLGAKASVIGGSIRFSAAAITGVAKQEWLEITNVESVPTEPVRCITVDSADHTYLIAGFIPTHNTMLMLWLADQWARMGVPQVIFDPKPTSDHSAAVLASGGTVASLDDLITGDGILDPIRSAQNPHDGIEAAGEMLLGVNPFPHNLNIFPKLMAALRIGVDAGADCIGMALTLAVEKNQDLAVVKDAVFELAEASTLFRACVGMHPGGRKLAVGEGITLIKIGNIRLPLPTPGTPMEKMSPPQRIATTVIKMVLTSSMAAMAGRDGVMHLDEAWVVLGSEPAEVDQIGRLARSLRVLPILYTQKCSDAVAAGIGSYISRVVILALEDDIEAKAACELAKLTPTPERIDRITNKTTVNRNTLRAMKNPETGKFIRGSVGWYVDLAGRAVTTEIVIPPEFLAQASTNATDMDIRKAAQPITVPA